MPKPAGDPIKRFAETIGASTLSAGGCIEWSGGRNAYNYGRFWMNGKLIGAHRAAWIIANGSIPPGMHVLHKCDNPPCVNVEHLFLGMPKDNVADMAAKGRMAVGDRVPLHREPWRASHGSKHYKAKLSESDIVRIRERCASGESQKHVARDFNMSPSHVSHIVAGRKWKYAGGGAKCHDQ